jgi:dTDP-4-amino-4,6-dideoxygalactose transaminase
MTDIQAALGVSQMSRLDEFVTRRHSLQQRYDVLLSDLPVVLPYQAEHSYSALHLYPIQIKLEQVDKSQAQVFQELRDKGVGVNVHYIPVHTQPYYKQLGFKEGSYPNAEHYYQRAISIPLFPLMTQLEQEQVVTILDEVII